MPSPRSSYVISGQSGFYHCISRCVRRSFLCGPNLETGESYDYRRQWLVDRLHDVTKIFAVDVYAYAVLHNHYHAVMYIDCERAANWSDDEVVTRWSKVFSWRRKSGAPTKLPKHPTEEQISLWRERLCSLSWVMQSINEPIARWANKEDEVTGHFWEGRFESVPVLDEAGLIACMSYVDMNPIRAGIATKPIDSDYTSIQERITKNETSETRRKSKKMGPITSEGKASIRLPITLRQYIHLIEAAMAKEKIQKKQTRALLNRLGLSIDGWVQASDQLLTLFRTAIGCDRAITSFLAKAKRVRIRDTQGRRLLYQR